MSNTYDEKAIQALSDAGAFCGVCGFQPGDRGCPDCEACWRSYVTALRKAGWAPAHELAEKQRVAIPDDAPAWVKVIPGLIDPNGESDPTGAPMGPILGVVWQWIEDANNGYGSDVGDLMFALERAGFGPPEVSDGR